MSLYLKVIQLSTFQTFVKYSRSQQKQATLDTLVLKQQIIIILVTFISSHFKTMELTTFQKIQLFDITKPNLLQRQKDNLETSQHKKTSSKLCNQQSQDLKAIVLRLSKRKKEKTIQFLNHLYLVKHLQLLKRTQSQILLFNIYIQQIRIQEPIKVKIQIIPTQITNTQRLHNNNSQNSRQRGKSNQRCTNIAHKYMRTYNIFQHITIYILLYLNLQKQAQN
eukprot:TRINITY_DN4377_c1_g1_i8.p2 TRINITY_DN4377_c1_g1~~TRINITY_DN4377_c1_g1_i8.p2  ORF type:complete len:222 (+),score=-18.78 TRINITY_DN4377_c1_g1_i8:663-1328(+)